MMRRFLACSLLTLVCSGTLQAQFSSSIKVLKRNHIVGEPVIARVTLTNFTGREQILQGQRMPWISFMLKTSHGSPVIARSHPAPGPVRIAAGQSVARDFNLTRQFQLNLPGNYSVTAVIRPDSNKIEGTNTPPQHFQLSEGRPYGSQKVGNVGPDGTTREYRVLQFRSDTSNQLFAQICDAQSGQTLRTIPLGDVLLLRKPSITIDGKRHLNVLFLTNPSTYIHYCISPSGEVLARDMHRRAATGDPRLTIMDRGVAVVTNSIFYDPQEAARKKAMVRKISERP